MVMLVLKFSSMNVENLSDNKATALTVESLGHTRLLVAVAEPVSCKQQV